MTSKYCYNIGMTLSIIIPSYKDPLIVKTIESIKDNFTGDYEVIAILDGYWPDFELPDYNFLKIVHLSRNSGMREAINSGIRIAKGEYLMRTDEHCKFGKGFDKVMVEACKPNWIMCATQYYLDPIKWERMDIPPVNHQKLVIQGRKKFAGQRWPERDEETKNRRLSETMSMQGSVWIMPHKWWDDVIGELQTEGYGPLIQDSHEMVFKTWKAGGELVLNRNTWFAHKHRSFSRTHNNGTKENPANCDAGYKYALDTWGEYYKTIKKRWRI